MTHRVAAGFDLNAPHEPKKSNKINARPLVQRHLLFKMSKGSVDIHAKWRFLLANADRVSGTDAELLRRIARRKLPDPTADTKGLTALLGLKGRAAMALLTNTDPDRVPALIAALPGDLRRSLEALDLSRRDLAGIAFPVLLVHGRDDPMIPASESRALANALPEETTRLMVLDSLFHIRLGEMGPMDALDLFRLAYRIVVLQESAPAPADKAYE